MSQARYLKRNEVTQNKQYRNPVQKILFTMLEPTVAPAPKIAAAMVRSPRQNKAIYREHTCIAQFLAKLLAVLLKLALLLGIIGVWRRSALANSQRHISIVGCRWGRRVNACLVIDRGHIALWEDTLLARTLITTTPPCMYMLALESFFQVASSRRTVIIHMLEDNDAIILRQREIACIGWSVCPHRRSKTQRRWDLGVCGWCLRGRGGV